MFLVSLVEKIGVNIRYFFQSPSLLLKLNALLEMLHSSTQIFPKIPYCLADTPIGEGCVGLGGWHGGGVYQLNCQTHLQRLKLVKNSVKRK